MSKEVTRMETQVPSDLALDFLETQAKQVREYKDDLIVALQSSIIGMRKKGLGECLAFPRPLLTGVLLPFLLPPPIILPLFQLLPSKSSSTT
jgi:hypothetical protein